MKLENQVCSLELAQKLKSLGVKQESLFFWVKGDSFVGKCPDCQKAGGLIPECAYCGGTGKDEKKYNYYLYPAKECWEDDRIKDCSAFTVAELGEMLPYSIDCRDIGHGRCYRQLSITENGIHQACYTNYTKDIGLQEADTEADARAKTLIYLLENGLLKA